MENKIYQCIDLTMQQVDLCKKVICLSNHVNMTYNYVTDQISFDPKRIEEILKNHPHISLENYVTTFTLHELGHSLDRENLLRSYNQTLTYLQLSHKLNTHEKETNSLYLNLALLEDEADFNFEKVAWDNAIHLNNRYQLVDMDILNELKTDSLLTYENNYNYSKELVDLQEKVPVLL